MPGCRPRPTRGEQTKGSWTQTVANGRNLVKEPGDWHCAQGQKVRIGFAGQRVKGLPPSDDFPTEQLGLAIRRGVGRKDPVGERGDKAVALEGGLLIRAADGVRERRQQKQPAFLQWLAEFWRESLRQAARGTDNDRVRTSQQDAETFPLHRGMKSADDRHARSAQFLRQVV